MIPGLDQAIGAAGSIIGGLVSGQRGLNKARTNILKKLLEEYNNMAPARAGVQSSYLGRLPGYMQANFPQMPQGAIRAGGGLGHIFNRGAATPGVGYVPQYTGANTPGFFPTYPGFNPNQMPQGM